MTPLQTVIDVSDEREGLVGKFYNCIFDEEKMKYDVNKTHKHKILRAYFYYANKENIQNSLLLFLDKRGPVFGRPEKYITSI